MKLLLYKVVYKGNLEGQRTFRKTFHFKQDPVHVRNSQAKRVGKNDPKIGNVCVKSHSDYKD